MLKKLTGIVGILLLMLVVSIPANATGMIYEDLDDTKVIIKDNMMQVDFDEQVIPTDSYIEIDISYIGGYNYLHGILSSVSSGNIPTYIMYWKDSNGNTLDADLINFEEKEYDIKSGFATIRIENPVSGAPMTITGKISIINGGYSGADLLSFDSINEATTVVEKNPWGLQRLAPQTLLNAVTATGESVGIDATNYNKVKFVVIKTGIATVDIQQCADNINYVDSHTDVDNIQSIGDETFKYIRVNVSAYTSGNVTVVMFAGN